MSVLVMLPDLSGSFYMENVTYKMMFRPWPTWWPFSKYMQLEKCITCWRILIIILAPFDIFLYTHAIDIFFDFLKMLIFILTEPI